MRLLLSSVFKPFGVDDAYGRKENVAELMHNQVTRVQGIFSIRAQNCSAGLHAIAENLDVPTAVLDFPSLSRFVKEVEKGYDVVGISFIASTFAKARKMAALTRRHAPKSTIVLGGHGAMIPGVAEKIDCDHVVTGDGIRWMRNFLKADPDAPFRHPVIRVSESQSILGVPLSANAGLLLPGIGCSQGCRFCSTTHFLGKRYTPFVQTGRELYEIALRVGKALGTTDLFLLDENFLGYEKRAREFAELLERDDAPYSLSLFSSARKIIDFGIENLVRMGVNFVWIGVESKRDPFDKNAGIDMVGLVNALHDHGIVVLASAILFLEHHEKDSIWEDIDYAIDLKPDLLQFMHLGPLPGTALYDDYRSMGKLREDLPYEEWHGQHRIWFDHPDFTQEETERILLEAFRKDFESSGPSVLRSARTKLRGYMTLKGSTIARFRSRASVLERQCQQMRCVLDAVATLAPQAHARALARETLSDYAQALGPKTLKQRALGVLGTWAGRMTRLRYSLFGDVRQPVTQFSRYRW